MIYHRFYEAPEADVADLIANHIAGRLITVGDDGTPRIIAELLERNRPSDHLAADAVSRTVARER